MRIKITMISGRKILIINNKVKSIEEFIKNQFSSKKDFMWYRPFDNPEILLNFRNIETIEEDAD